MKCDCNDCLRLRVKLQVAVAWKLFAFAMLIIALVMFAALAHAGEKTKRPGLDLRGPVLGIAPMFAELEATLHDVGESESMYCLAFMWEHQPYARGDMFAFDAESRQDLVGDVDVRSVYEPDCPSWSDILAVRDRAEAELGAQISLKVAEDVLRRTTVPGQDMRTQSFETAMEEALADPTLEGTVIQQSWKRRFGLGAGGHRITFTLLRGGKVLMKRWIVIEVR